jgi:sterol 3beta-glucosyltransferase
METSSIAPQKNKKQIVMLTYGSRGDVEPFVALGLRLITEGFIVRLIAPKPFKPLVESTGIEFIPIDSDPDELGQLFANSAGSNWFKMIKNMADHLMPIAREAFQTIVNSVDDADLIMHSFLMTDAGHTLALKLNIPEISVQLFPVFLSTREFPPVALPDIPFGKFYRKGMHHLNTVMFRNSARFMYKRLQKTSSDLPDLTTWPFSGPFEDQPPILFAYSIHVLPKPDDWPSNSHVTGYWQMPLGNGWEPPKSLNDFIKEGKPPIFFSPGSMQSDKSNALLEMVILATRNVKQRIVLGVSPDTISDELTGRDIICAKGVPHAWLFPKMSYILHHGGAGTSGTAVASGVPNSATPFSLDQSFWAKRLSQLGVGPAAPATKKLTIPTLEQLILDATENDKYSKQAKFIAEKMQSKVGISTTIAIIQNLISGS